MNYELGFLGGGQLARMSIQAAQQMGLRCVSLDPSGSSPASFVADSRQGQLEDPEAILDIFAEAEFVTFENEFIRAGLLEGVAVDRLIPSAQSLAIVQDKLLQRRALHEAGVPSPLAVSLEANAEEAIRTIGFPMVLKARFGGYDGKGTRYARSPRELDELSPEWSKGGWLAEQFVPFTRELAVMVAIGGDGAVTFPTVETVQTNSVCDLVFPCDADASKIALDAVRAVQGFGLFGVELFQLPDCTILVNELAPRPHNSGHYTLDWGGPSQFEYHVRSVLGLKLAPPRSEGFAVMANLLGQPQAKDFQRALRAASEVPGAHVHWYQKAEAKPGRKMGHINVAGHLTDTVDEVVEKAKLARSEFYRAWTSP